jgi:hypothetical protein
MFIRKCIKYATIASVNIVAADQAQLYSCLDVPAPARCDAKVTFELCQETHSCSITDILFLYQLPLGRLLRIQLTILLPPRTLAREGTVKSSNQGGAHPPITAFIIRVRP